MSIKRFIVVTGTIAAGKDELANYLMDRHQVQVLEVGEFARQLGEADEQEQAELNYDVTLEELAEAESEEIMRQLIMALNHDHEQYKNGLVIMGVRTPAEISLLKEQLGSELLTVYIQVGNQTARYERTQARNFPTDSDDMSTFIDKDDEQKLEYGIMSLADLADVILWNNHSLPAYYQQIEIHVVPHLRASTSR